MRKNQVTKERSRPLQLSQACRTSLLLRPRSSDLFFVHSSVAYFLDIMPHGPILRASKGDICAFRNTLILACNSVTTMRVGYNPTSRGLRIASDRNFES